MSSPAVSVILSVYNNEQQLPVALDSILRQTWEDWEVLAINDGSTDGSGEVLERYAREDARVRVVHQENRGLGPALHRACQLAKGRYLARQDADDISCPQRFARQVTYLETHPNAILCGTWAWIVRPGCGPEYSYEMPDDPQLLRRLLQTGVNPLIHGSVMLRKAIYDAEGQGYRFKVSQDFDLWLRLSELGDFGMVTSSEYVYSNSMMGLSGEHALRARLVALASQLREERLAQGHEVTDWRAVEIQAQASVGEIDPVLRRTAEFYNLSLTALRRRDWVNFRRHIRVAAQGQGNLARKARLLRCLKGAAPLIARFYRWRERGSLWEYLRPLPQKASLPEDAIPALAFAGAESSSLKAVKNGGSV